MCLTCAFQKQTKEEKAKLLGDSYVVLNTPDNKRINLSTEQIEEIIENALFVLCTGVDCTCDIWAIQWERDYSPKTIKYTILPDQKTIIRYAEEALEEELSILDTTGQAYRKTFRPLWLKFLESIGVDPCS